MCIRIHIYIHRKHSGRTQAVLYTYTDAHSKPSRAEHGLPALHPSLAGSSSLARRGAAEASRDPEEDALLKLREYQQPY